MIRKTLDDHIEITPTICGGQPRVAGHRITVRQIVIWHDRMGLSADEISARYDVTVADVYAALAYYFSNREEMDAAAEADAVLVTKLRKAVPSKLRAKLSDDGRNE